MRKTLLFLNILLLAFSIKNVSAQYDVLLGSDPSCVAYSKDAALCVASSDDAAIISYFVHQGYRELYSFSVQNPTQSTSIKLPDRMWINDMVRLEEYIYFCGEYDGEAMIGMIKEDAFSLPSANIEYYTVPTRRNFNKLDVGRNSAGDIMIAAVTYELGASPDFIPTNYVYLLNLSSPANCDYYSHSGSYYYDRMLQDVANTNDYFVTCGVSSFSTNQFVVAKA